MLQRRKPKRMMPRRHKSYSISTYQHYQNYKWYLLIFLCIWFIFATYFLYTPSTLFTSQSISTHCSNIDNNHKIIDSICSFASYLNIDSWKHRQCYFKHPVEGHWLIGYLMTLWYKLTKNQHCPVINVHDFINDDNNQKNTDILHKQMENDDYNNGNNDQFTVLINTWERNECLIKSVEHYLKCDNIAQIRIIWSDPNHDIPSYLRSLKLKNNNNNKLIFDEYKDDLLTNRFKYNTEWITNGIFQTDDDIMFSCQLLSNTFKLWQLIPDYMIGFAPRQPDNEYTQKSNISPNNLDTNKQFYSWDHGFTQCKYSLLFTTLGGFMHKKYYKLYTEYDDINNHKNGWKIIKDSVNGNITAEDISMSLFYSFVSNNNKPPITVVVPESNMFIKDFLKCQEDKSIIMHTNSHQKRTNIYIDILKVLGYYDNNNKMELMMDNSLWVDVMPLNDEKCWAG